MKRFLRLAGAGALACGLLGVTEAIAVLSSSGLRYESPALELLAQVLRYGTLGALFGILLGRLRPGLSIACVGRWTFALGLFVMAGWWVHSALLQNIGLLEPVSLAGSAGILAVVLAVLFLTNKVRDAHLPKGTLALILLSLPLASLSFGTDSGTPVSAAPARPGLGDITLVVIDTLRADHLSCYGYSTGSGEPTSPVMDAVANRGMRFPVVHAQAPWTRPSMASLHTGLYPSAHKVNRIRDRIPRSATTLAERLHGQGYRTGAFSANAQVSPTFGFAQGFDFFWLSSERPLVRFTMWGEIGQKLDKRVLRRNPQAGRDSAALVTDKIVEWVGEAGSRPTFTYVQYIDPHGPYDPPEWLLSSERPDIRTHLAQAKNFQHADPFPFGQRPEVNPSVRDQVVDLYDGEIRYVDRELGRLLTHLEATGRLDPEDWLVVTSDHGEEFFEHRQWGHGHSLFEEQLHVPLLVTGPGISPGSTAAHPVSLLDLHPTIAAWAGGPCGDEVAGVDLAPVLAGGELENPLPLYAERLLAHPMRSIRRGEDKLIEMPDLENTGVPLLLHFNLGDKGGETLRVPVPAGSAPLDRTDPAFEAPPLLVKALAEMREIATRFSLEGEAALLGADVLQALEEMGYVGGEGGKLLGHD